MLTITLCPLSDTIGALLDECSLKIHKCSSNSHCVDENDGYSCVCNSGYVRDDRDQCSGMLASEAP